MTTVRVKYLLYKEDNELKIRQDVPIEVQDAQIKNEEILEKCIALPTFENSHIHVLDSWLSEFFNKMYIDDVVGAPYGIKYFYLQIAAESTLRESTHYALSNLRRTGTAKAKVVVEYGLKNFKIIEEEAKRTNVEAELYLEPSEFHITPNENTSEKIIEELKKIAQIGKNIELISPLNYTIEELELARELKKKHNLKVMTHVSETEDTYQDGDLKLAVDILEADVLVHCVHVKDNDIELLRGKTIVVTPRSNMKLVGRLPPIEKFLKYDDIKVQLGTDNVGLCEPNLWLELRTLSTHVSSTAFVRLFENCLTQGAEMQLVLVRDLCDLSKFSDSVEKFVRVLCNFVEDIVGIVKTGYC